MTAKKRVTAKDFHLLLTFLEDENEGTQKLVKDQLKGLIKRNPRLIKSGQSVGDLRVRESFNEFVEEYQFEKLEPAFRQLFQRGANLDLEKGTYLLATIAYPDLKQKDVSQTLDRMAEEVNRMMAHLEPAPTKGVNAMRRFLFEKEKFSGNTKNFFDPDNCFINRVLDRRAGIPISLSCVYLFIAWRLGLPVHGVGLPGHFVVGHRTPRGVTHIDAFNRGKILRSKDCEMLVRKLGMPFRQEYLDPMTNLGTLARLIVNLINLYTDRGQTSKARRLAQLLQLIEE